MFGDKDAEEIKALLPNTTRYLEEAVDVPLSSSLSAEDCDQLIRAVRKVAAAVAPDRRHAQPARAVLSDDRGYAPAGQGSGPSAKPAAGLADPAPVGQ